MFKFHGGFERPVLHNVVFDLKRAVSIGNPRQLNSLLLLLELRIIE